MGNLAGVDQRGTMRKGKGCMEIDWDESDAIWDSIPGAEKVWGLYQFWPTLHDSVALELTYEQETKRLEMLFQFSGRPRGSDPEDPWVISHFRLAWEIVDQVDFAFSPNGISSMWFSRQKGRLVTRFDLADRDEETIIVSESVAVVAAKQVPSRSWDQSPNRVVIR